VLSIINNTGLEEAAMAWTCRGIGGGGEVIQNLRGKIFLKTSSLEMENRDVIKKDVTRLPILKL
jgi:hypothetical protein